MGLWKTEGGESFNGEWAPGEDKDQGRLHRGGDMSAGLKG